MENFNYIPNFELFFVAISKTKLAKRLIMACKNLL